MPEKVFLGIDTSNYTTSFSVCNYNGEVLCNIKKLLPVKEGENGLRQSDAVFSHIKNISAIYEEISEFFASSKYEVLAIGYSAYPRDAEGSYMPCFLVGESIAKMLSAVNGIPIYKFSHQNGHISSAIYSSGAPTSDEFIAFHVSGGTTEILNVTNGDNGYKVDIIGGSSDLHAGQAIDRIGVKMGILFPCGKEMEKLALQNTKPIPKKSVCVKGFSCNLSGLENMASNLYDKTEDKNLVCSFVFDFIEKTLENITNNLREKYKEKAIIYAGGVMSNSIIKERLKNKFDNVYFAKPEFSSDNACGIALLARKQYLK
jgi:N6-L-threonylcarbamoyladenine synthase